MELILSPGYTPLLAIAVLCAVLLLVGGCYLRAFRSLGRGRWIVLFLLRAAAILLVGLLLFRPILRFSELVLDKPLLVLLFDRSESMSVDDDQSGETRFARAVREVHERRETLGKDFRIEEFVFAQRTDPIASESLAKLEPTGKMTLIPKAVRDVVGRFSKESKPLVFLFSDGIENGGGAKSESTAALLATGAGKNREGQYTLNTIGVGSNLRDNPEFRDIQVLEIESPAQASIQNRIKINATIHAIGLDGRVVKAVLLDGQTSLEEREITLTNSQTGEPLVFEHVPTTLGRHTYTIQVEAVEGEAITLNNARSVATVVLSKKVRVLYIEGSMRQEYGAITERFLSKDPDLEFCSLLRTKAGTFTRRSNGETLETLPETAEDFAKFDVFILGDFDASYWKEGALTALVERVREGAGLIMVGGSHTLGGGGYAESPLAAIAPVNFGPRNVGDIKEQFLPQLTPDGRVHPIFANIAGFFPTQTAGPTMTGLPELNGASRIAATSPGATVLATLPTSLANQGSVPQPANTSEETDTDGTVDDTTRPKENMVEDTTSEESDTGNVENVEDAENTGNTENVEGVEAGDSEDTGETATSSTNDRVGTPMAVLAVQPVGNGQFAVFCGDTTRNWQQAPAVLGQDSPFIRFWGQMVRWAAGREDSSLGGRTSLIAEVDRPQYSQNEPISIVATLRAVDGEGIANSPVTAKLYRLESIDATVQNEDKPEAELALTPVAGAAGRYTASYRATGGGWFEIVVSASGLPPDTVLTTENAADSTQNTSNTENTSSTKDTGSTGIAGDAENNPTETGVAADGTLTAEPLMVEVGEQYRELEDISMNDAYLSELATAAGGQYRHISTVGTLFDQLDRSRQQQRKQHDIPLSNPPVVWWAVLIGLLSLEWWLRRVYRLR